MKLFFSGPEQPNLSSEFCDEALKQIQAAQKEIVINHMYFHPTNELRRALVDAAVRGVKIKIITCGIHTRSPNGQSVFGPRNKYNYAKLISKISKELRGNVEVYEYTQDKKELHKKVMVFDRKYVLAGSSNFVYKSLETTSDHEVNFLAASPKFAQETYRVCEHDMRLSKKVKNPTELTFFEYRKASFHRLMAPIIG